MEEFINTTKALSDKNRLRAIMALASGELCICQIIQLLGLAPSTVSKHMTILHRAGLTETRKDGHWIYHRLALGKRRSLARAALEFTKKSLTGKDQIHKDALRLLSIRQANRTECSSRYRN